MLKPPRTFVVALFVLLASMLTACTLTVNPPTPNAETADSAAAPVSIPVSISESEALRAAITTTGLTSHLTELQAIANANGGTRMAGSPGYDQSLDYVVGLLSAAGYEVTEQSFDIDYFEPVQSTFSQTSPQTRTFVPYDPETQPNPAESDYTIVIFSGSGVVSDTPVVAIGNIRPDTETASTPSDSGCAPEDFQDDDGTSLVTGKVALLQRGTCPYSDKAINAEAAGALAVLIFNDGASVRRQGVIFGSLGVPDSVDIPVIGLDYALGMELAQGANVSLDVEVISEVRQTSNLLAETPGGNTDNVIIAGAHLDSVPEGPGINDNGSGVSAILETALQMQKLGIAPQNKVRFAFWAAEESGLIGSSHYVSSLSDEEIQHIALYLNFDMVASPNYVYYIYDGSQQETSADRAIDAEEIEQIFLDYFAAQSLPSLLTEFNDRSDHAPFIEAGIPAGGVFTGELGEKTAEEQAAFGGTEGLAYDPCYHLACDTYENVNQQALDVMADAAAHAILALSMMPQ